MTDGRDDRPTSSEEMLRRAREEAAPPVPAEGHRAEPPEASESPSSVADSYAEFLKRSSITETPETEAGRAPEPAPTEPEPPAPRELTDEELAQRWAAPRSAETSERSWDPNWTPSQPTNKPGYGGAAPVGAPDPSRLPPTRPPSKGFRIPSWIIVGALVLVGGAIFNLFTSSSSVQSLAVGDCIADPGLGEFATVDKRDCEGPHDLEIFAEVDAIAVATASYPGVDAITDYSYEQCFDEFEPFVGVPYADSVYVFDVLYPTRDAWQGGDRTSLCVIFEIDSDFNLAPKQGTARNTRR